MFPGKNGLTYTYTFTRMGGDPQTLDPVNGVFTLQYAEWSVEVKAYAGTADDDNQAASGSKTFTVNAASQTVAVELAGATETGTGTFSYRIQYPEGATVTSLTLRKLPELTTRVSLDSPSPATSDGVTTISGTANSVPAGFYFVTVQLEKDGKSAGRNEVAHIYNNLTSEFGTEAEPAVFVLEDFTATPTGTGLFKGPAFEEATRIGAYTVADALDYIQSHTADGGNWYIVADRDETFAAWTLSYPGKSVRVTLMGAGDERRINSALTVSGSAGKEVTLVLDDNIRLDGSSVFPAMGSW